MILTGANPVTMRSTISRSVSSSSTRAPMSLASNVTPAAFYYPGGAP